MVTVTVKAHPNSSLFDAITDPTIEYAFAGSTHSENSRPSNDDTVQFDLRGLKGETNIPASLSNLLGTQQPTSDTKIVIKEQEVIEEQEVDNDGHNDLSMEVRITGSHGYSRVDMNDKYILSGVITQISKTSVHQATQIEFNARDYTGSAHIPRGLLCYVEQKEAFEKLKKQQQEQNAALAAKPVQTSPKTKAKPHIRRKSS